MSREVSWDCHQYRTGYDCKDTPAQWQGSIKKYIWLLTINKTSGPQVQYNMHSFKETTEECLGANLMSGELEEVGIPDTHNEYLPHIDEDQNQNEVMFPNLDKKPFMG